MNSEVKNMDCQYKSKEQVGIYQSAESKDNCLENMKGDMGISACMHTQSNGLDYYCYFYSWKLNWNDMGGRIMA